MDEREKGAVRSTFLWIAVLMGVATLVDAVSLLSRPTRNGVLSVVVGAAATGVLAFSARRRTSG